MKEEASPGRGCGESAMHCAADRQTVPPGGTLTLETEMICSSAGVLAGEGNGSLSVRPGQYLLSVTADAEADQNVGAGLALNGAPIAYAQCRLARGGEHALCLHAILPVTGRGCLTVYNNTLDHVHYRNAVLTAVYLGECGPYRIRK